MVATFFIGLLIVLAIIALTIRGNYSKRLKAGNGREDDNRFGRLIATVAAGILLIVGAIIGINSTVYTQGVGEAKVIINVDGTIAGSKTDPGFGLKAPWQSTVDFDLFSQTLQFAGGSDGSAPSYTGGSVDGFEVTAPVKGGAQSNFDLSVTYSLDPDKVVDIYSEFKSQERFTQQVIVQQVLTTVRKVPAAYTPVEFRGEKSGEAADIMLDRVQTKLTGYGVDVSILNTQKITYTDEVEESIKAVEVAQQKEEKAQAELRATEVSAQAQVIEAEAQAKANNLLDRSLTPEVLEAKRLETLVKIGEKGNLVVVPEGSTPFVNVTK